LVGTRKGKIRILGMIVCYLAERGAASAREIASFLSEGSGRGVTVAQVSNFLAADARFIKVKKIRISSGVRGGEIWLWELRADS
jgi:hypothetical protein